MERALLAQALGHAQPVHRVHPGEAGGDRARLVGLHAADEVPGERPILQCRNLAEPLVEVTLAEIGEPQICGRRHET